MFVRFADIMVIVDHHCLNFLFIDIYLETFIPSKHMVVSPEYVFSSFVSYRAFSVGVVCL